MKEIYKALAAFQQEVPVIYKDTQGYGYSYADLPAILEVINPLMKKHGLGFTQLMENKSIKTIVFHCESGESLEGSIDIPQGVELKGMNDFQVLGSAITYMRRYALSAALGLVTDKDNDAHGEQVKKAAVKKTDFTETHFNSFKLKAIDYKDSATAIKFLENYYSLSDDMKSKITSLYQ